MINGPIVCMVGLYKDRWRGMILAQITTALTGGLPFIMFIEDLQTHLIVKENHQ